MMYLCVFLLLLAQCLAQAPPEFLLESQVLPEDDRFKATVGNGIVATQPWTDAIFLNDLYNGYYEDSHRARIPSMLNVAISGATGTESYWLDMYHGIQGHIVENTDYVVEQHIMAHRELRSLLVHQVSLHRLGNSPGDVVISLDVLNDMTTNDLTLVTDRYDASTAHTHGTINFPETSNSDLTTVHIFWDDIPESLTLADGEDELVWTGLVSISKDEVEARNTLETARSVSAEQLIDNHKRAWESVWTAGHIDIRGNMYVAQTTNAAIYYIISNLPSSPNENDFGGLSPTGLSRGGRICEDPGGPCNDYSGHIFWDMDTWMLPPIVLLYPETGPIMLASRSRDQLKAEIEQNALRENYDGIKYPWEMAHTGAETCPWDPASDYQHHVTADVAHALLQYLYATEDTDAVSDTGHVEGRLLSMEIGRFWRSRTNCSDLEVGCQIFGVMGPDENVYNVNNNVYTNYVAKLALETPHYIRDKMNIQFTPAEDDEIDEFVWMADNMYIPFDEEIGYHPQYDDFDPFNSTLKQSDAVLLGYPLMKLMTPEVRRNDLVIYEQITDPNGPDTGTWSMHTVGWLELDEQTNAFDNFQMMFRNVLEPFKNFCERNPENPEEVGMGATTFITGMGGYLQSLLFGYAGVRLRKYQMDINPFMIPNTDSWSVHGLNYLGSSMDIEVTADSVTLIVTMESHPMVLIEYDDTRHVVRENQPIVISNLPATLITVDDEHNMEPPIHTPRTL